MKVNDLFYEATENERKSGYLKKGNKYFCLFCEFETEDGIIYKNDDQFFDARKEMENHIENHGGVFDYLLGFDKKEIGLSERQVEVLKLFNEGISDYDIQKELNVGSVSTIRNHRYALKEKLRQAKAMVTIMSFLEENEIMNKTMVKPHKTATMVDARYDITVDENDQIINKYFPNGTDGELLTFSIKEKAKIVVLREIVKRFEFDKRYGHKQVDEILKGVYPKDYVTIRRYLIQYGLLDRLDDGTVYWRKIDEKSSRNDKTKRKELLQSYKTEMENTTIYSGIYKIRNKENERILISIARNIDNLNSVKHQLKNGVFPNAELQRDYNEMGSDTFEFVEIERFNTSEPGYTHKMLRAREREIKDELQPYGEKGYHLRR
jgi:DNA-binding CsgD family transcriptional regulator